jgi:hypothetical protein
MYDKENNSPIIIDFGISYLTTDIVPDKYNNIFYTDQYYPYWCIEIHVLSYIEQIIRRTANLSDIITQEKMDNVINSYIGNLSIFISKHGIPFKEEETQLLNQNMRTYFSSYVNNKTWEELFDALIQPEIYSSWDNYSLAITYLIIGKSAKLKEMTYSNPDTLYVPMINNCITLWKSIVLAAPASRPTAEKTMEMLHKIDLYV